jgi:integrase
MELDSEIDDKPKYSFHSLRHWFASWCINGKEDGARGVSAKRAQTLLGHSSMIMTLDTYGHWFGQ